MSENHDIVYDYRVYYDDDGAVLTYAMQDVNGLSKWISITREQFAEANHTCRVIDGKLMKPVRAITYIRMVKNNTGKGVRTSKHDMCIIDSENLTEAESVFYEITHYEKNSGYT